MRAHPGGLQRRLPACHHLSFLPREIDPSAEPVIPDASNGDADITIAADEQVGLAAAAPSRSRFRPLPTALLTKSQAHFVGTLTSDPCLATPVRGLNKARITLTVGNVDLLNGEQRLNDEIINSMVALIYHRDTVARSAVSLGAEHPNGSIDAAPSAPLPRAFMFNTYFFSRLLERGGTYDYEGVRNWGRKGNLQLENVDIIIVPVLFHGNHWVLVVINVLAKNFLYHDPLHGELPENVIGSLRRWLCDELTSVLGDDAPAEWGVDQWPVVKGSSLPE